MTLTLKKINHRDADRIGVFFPYDQATNNKLKLPGATYSRTWRCRYFDCTPEKYRLLKENFYELEIDKSEDPNQVTSPAAGKKSRDLPPIGAITEANGITLAPKLPSPGSKPGEQGHKAAPVLLAKKRRLKRFDNLGQRFATHFLDTVPDMHYVQQLLGHSDICATMIYPYLRQGNINKIRSPLDNLQVFAAPGVNIKNAKNTTKWRI